MDAEALILSLILIALLLLSGTFSGSETALFSLDRIRLRRFESSGSRRERRVAAAAARPERLLAGILFGNTLVNVASSSVAVALARRIQSVADPDTRVLGAVIADTFLLLVLGEIVPKGLAVQGPAGMAKFTILLLDPLLRILRPGAAALEALAGLGLRRTEGRAEPGLTRPELQLLFEDVEGGEGFSEGEGSLAANVFHFFEARAFEIMTPRVDLSGVSVDAGREELRRRVLEARHTRLPVYRDSLDQILGFINTKEFLLDPGLPMEVLLKPVYFVPERARVHGILREVQARKLSMVVVVNEFGGTSGIITGEDLVEEIVGDIFDEQEGDQEPEILRVGEGVWRVDGLLSLTELGETLGIATADSPAQTVAGHVAHLLGRPPRGKETIREGNVVYRILQTLRHRARRVEITVREEAPSIGGER